MASIIPESTPYKSLADVIDPLSKISYGVLVPGPDVDKGVPFVRIQDLDIANPPVQPAKTIAADIEAAYVRTRLKGGEVLLGVVGSIGKVGLVPESWIGANIARAVCRIVPGPGNGSEVSGLCVGCTRNSVIFSGGDANASAANAECLATCRVAIPVPLINEQKAIVIHIEAIQAKTSRARAIQSDVTIELDALLPSILDRAFKGLL
ncbi:MAG: hypothetical protein IPK16_01765 [Anaerolineales bacterium]|nr:hypothetical protein [Anaerolineales bacterium]